MIAILLYLIPVVYQIRCSDAADESDAMADFVWALGWPLVYLYYIAFPEEK